MVGQRAGSSFRDQIDKSQKTLVRRQYTLQLRSLFFISFLFVCLLFSSIYLFIFIISSLAYVHLKTFNNKKREI